MTMCKDLRKDGPRELMLTKGIMPDQTHIGFPNRPWLLSLLDHQGHQEYLL
jgi:hypothetical protein